MDVSSKADREPKSQRGLTLIEMLVTLVIMSVLMTVATPIMEVMFEQRLRYEADRLLNSINYASSESMKRDERVSMCLASSATECDPMASTKNRWDVGWLFFVDENSNTVIDTGEDILRFYAARPNYQMISGTSGGVTFFPDGVIQTSIGLIKTFHICAPNSAIESVTVAINAGGSRVSVSDVRGLGAC